MQKITLTCPFTGGEFVALQDADGNLYAKHQLTGEDLKINYNCSIKNFNVPKSFFKHIETVSLSQAAEILEVSRQRISTIAANNAIRPVTVNDQRRFILSDVLEYKRTRKVGAPKKEQ